MRRAAFEREGHTPWQVEHGSRPANPASHRNGARGVPGQYKPASTQAGNTATVYGGEASLAHSAVTLEDGAHAEIRIGHRLYRVKIADLRPG